jgi:hypothetical protein
MQTVLNVSLLILHPCKYSSGFGSLVVSIMAGSNPAEAAEFFGGKHPQHAFLRKGSKTVRPMSQICGMLKNPVITWKLGRRQNSPAISCPIVPPFATRSARVVGDVEASGNESWNV